MEDGSSGVDDGSSVLEQAVIARAISAAIIISASFFIFITSY